MAEALLRIGAYVAERGLHGEGPYQAARDLLLREIPRTGGQPLHKEGETAVASAIRICAGLTGGILPIQGPPGAGKTYHRRANDLRTRAPRPNRRHHGK